MDALANELRRETELFSIRGFLYHDQLMKDLSRQKDAILKERLKQLGLEMYLEEEEGRRFKRFMKEIQGDRTTIYFNDGSIDGLRIITFVNSFKHSDLNEKNYLTMTINYY